MSRTRLVFVLALALLVAGCADKGKNRIPAAPSLSLGTVAPTTAAPPGPTLAAGGPVPTAAGGAAGGLHAVGEVVVTATGNTVTLHAVDSRVVAPATAPPADASVLAVDVEACAKGGPTHVGPELFRLQLDDTTSQAPVDGGRQPALPAGPVPGGSCVRAWVSFDVPAGRAPAQLIFTGSSVVRWPLT